MNEAKKSFKEKYPNHRSETRNEKIVCMAPGQGWWKVVIAGDNESWVEPVAFFATIEYEMRFVWDGGSSAWEKEMSVFANSGIGDDWFLNWLDSTNMEEERLFYDPDYRLSRDAQHAGNEWLKEAKNK